MNPTRVVLGSVSAAILGLALVGCSSGSSGNANAHNSGNTGGGSVKQRATQACVADFKSLEVALEAYKASPQNAAGNYPSPPAPWSQSTYASNFGPLTAQSSGGSFLSNPLGTTYYVIEYDGSGHVWVEPAGQYDTAYNPAHAASNVCSQVAG